MSLQSLGTFPPLREFVWMSVSILNISNHDKNKNMVFNKEWKLWQCNKLRNYKPSYK